MRHFNSSCDLAGLARLWRTCVEDRVRAWCQHNLQTAQIAQRQADLDADIPSAAQTMVCFNSSLALCCLAGAQRHVDRHGRCLPSLQAWGCLTSHIVVVAGASNTIVQSFVHLAGLWHVSSPHSADNGSC